MKRNPVTAGLLSLLVPGLGQIYGGEHNKGGAIVFGAIVIANFNIILSWISVASPAIPTGMDGGIQGEGHRKRTAGRYRGAIHRPGADLVKKSLLP
jgi:TM2 domain-containing membrane protein YozV